MKNHRLQSYREIDFAVSAFSPVANRFLPDIPADSIKPSLEWTLRISEKFPRGILEIKPYRSTNAILQFHFKLDAVRRAEMFQ